MEELEVADFFVLSHIRMMSYFRLGQLRVNEYDCPALAKNRRKAAMKIQRNPQLWILP